MSAAEQLVHEYELIYILRPTTSPGDARKVSDRVTEVLEKQGAHLTRVDNWGRRRLAYPIDKHTRGIFVYVKFVGPGDTVAELERNLRILDMVVRYQTVRLGDLFDMTQIKVDPDEVQFRDIEEASEEEDDEPTFEERLGMRARAGAERAGDEDRDEDLDDDIDDDDDDVVEHRGSSEEEE